MARTVLVTGGAGFIGANFIRYWISSYPSDDLIILDALTDPSSAARLPTFVDYPKVSFVQGDICDENLVRTILHRHQVQWVVHFAAETHVDESIHDPDKFVRANICGTHALLKCCLERMRKQASEGADFRFHHVSTDEVYGSLLATDAPFTEMSPYRPSSPYSASKAASDHLVSAYYRTFGLPATRTNCSNNYGPLQAPNKLIPMTIVHALRGESIRVYGSGENIRDWLHVNDHCRAIDLVMHKGAAGTAYNVGAGCERRNIDVVRLICSKIAQKFAGQVGLHHRFQKCPASRGSAPFDLVTFVRDRPGHDFRYALDDAHIGASLQFRPACAFDEGIESTVDWYLHHADWWAQ